jgi:hypothetical protein
MRDATHAFPVAAKVRVIAAVQAAVVLGLARVRIAVVVFNAITATRITDLSEGATVDAHLFHHAATAVGGLHLLAPFAWVVADHVVGTIIDALLRVTHRRLAGVNIAFADAFTAVRVAQLALRAIVDAGADLVSAALTLRRVGLHAVVAFGVAHQVAGAVVDALLVGAHLAGEDLIALDAIGAGVVA